MGLLNVGRWSRFEPIKSWESGVLHRLWNHSSYVSCDHLRGMACVSSGAKLELIYENSENKTAIPIPDFKGKDGYELGY